MVRSNNILDKIKEAEALILKSNGEFCAEYMRQADGSVVTRVEPPGRERLGVSHLRLAAGTLMAIISLTSISMAQTGQASLDQKPAKIEAIDKKTTEKQPEVLLAGMSGVVHDSNGGRVSGAVIALFSELGAEIRSFSSNETGVFQMGRLPVGTYKVKIEAMGISQFASEKLIVRSEDKQELTGVQILLGSDGVVMVEEEILINDLTVRCILMDLPLSTAPERIERNPWFKWLLLLPHFH